MLYPSDPFGRLIVDVVYSVFGELWEHVDKYDEETLDRIIVAAGFHWTCEECGYSQNSFDHSCDECEYSRAMDAWVSKTKWPIEIPYEPILKRAREQMAANITEWMLRANMTILKNQNRIGLEMGKLLNMICFEPNKEKAEEIIESLSQIMSESSELVDELKELTDKATQS